nr:MAG TPA: hypothetical protein [Bacteriophage sp.]
MAEVKEMEALLETAKNISLIAGAVAVVWKVFTFTSNIGKKIDINSDEIRDIKEKLNRDYNKIDKLNQANKHICLFLIDISDHMINGNHIDKLKETRKNVITFLSEGVE